MYETPLQTFLNCKEQRNLSHSDTAIILFVLISLEGKEVMGKM